MALLLFIAAICLVHQLIPVKNSQAIASRVKEVIERTDERTLKTLQGYEDVKTYEWEMASKSFLDIFMSAKQ